MPDVMDGRLKGQILEKMIATKMMLMSRYTMMSATSDQVMEARPFPKKARVRKAMMCWTLSLGSLGRRTGCGSSAIIKAKAAAAQKAPRQRPGLKA